MKAIKKIKYLLFVIIFGLVTFIFWSFKSINNVVQTTAVIEYYQNEQEQQTSELAFHTMMDVLTHKRCVNCHPNDNVPKQGEDSHPHYFDITGGENDHGYRSLDCTTCHQTENNNYSGVPGAPEWALAPDKMKWEGLDRYEIAESMLNENNNGGRNHEELVHHLTEHKLVLWAWNPGVNADGVAREKPPVPLNEYRVAVKKWFELGANIPSH